MLFDLNSCALENFECHYNKYCAQQDLKPFLKEELQAELASRFDCKFKRVRISVEINQCVGHARYLFTKSFLGDYVAVLAPSSAEESTPPRRRAGVASMAGASRQFD